MTATTVEIALAVVSTITAAALWIWHTATKVTRHIDGLQGNIDTTRTEMESHVANAKTEHAVIKSEVIDLKTKSEHLRDGQIRTETMMGLMTSQLAKLDRIDTIGANTEFIKETVNRLEQQAIPRSEVLSLHDSLKDRVRALEERRP